MGVYEGRHVAYIVTWAQEDLAGPDEVFGRHRRGKQPEWWNFAFISAKGQDSGTIKRECAGRPVSYRRAGERRRRMPLRRRGFGSSLQRQVLRARFWQTRLIYLRPTLRCGHSLIQRARP